MNRLRCSVFGHPGFQRTEQRPAPGDIDSTWTRSRCVRCGETLNDAIWGTSRTAHRLSFTSIALAVLAIVFAIVSIIATQGGL